MKISNLLGLLSLCLFIWTCNNDHSLRSDLFIIDGDVLIDSDEVLEDWRNLLSQTQLIKGDLLISNTSTADLSFLSNLTEIEGKLELSFNDQLLSLDGLENLRSIVDLMITYNENLEVINNLGAVDLNGVVTIYQDNITTIESFEEVTQLEALTISGIKELTQVNCFPNLTQINGVCRIIDNADIQSVTLPSLETIGGNLDVELNQNLSEISLPKLHRLGGQFIFTGNANIPNLDGFEQLQMAEADIIITQNPILENLDGLNQVRAGNDLTIYILRNAQLAEFCGIKTLIAEAGSHDLNCTIEDNLLNPTAVEILEDCP